MGQEHMVLCPFCDTDKNKCAVNPEKGVFQCWICQERGPIMKLVEHLYKLRHISQKDMEAIKARKGKLKLSDAISVFKRKEQKEPDVLWSKTIPCVFPNNTYAITGFAPQNAIEEKLHTHVQEYLYGRGLTDEEINRYRLHFCCKLGSVYHGHVVIPALGQHGRELTYWTTRATLPNPQPKTLHAGRKYSRFSAKYTLLNEHLVVGTTMALCEGPFDAFSIMSVVGIPACPLIGKQMHSYHKHVLLSRGVKRVYVCLDPDARDAQSKITRALVRVGIEPLYVDLQDGDPNDIDPKKLYVAFRQATYKKDNPLSDICGKF
jgi:hypothetical protein